MKMLQHLLCVICVSFFSFSAFAANCPDVNEAIGQASENRSQKVKDIYNSGMPDPEEYRINAGNCLDVIVSTGDIFSMGVKIPDLSTIFDSVCQAVSAEVQGAIDDAINKGKAQVQQIVAPYKVYGDPEGLANDALSSLGK